MSADVFLTVLYVIAINFSGLFAAPSSNSSKFSLVEPHIVGGSNIIGNLPYQISVRVDELGNGDSSNLRHFCGGSLILPDIVLTAAHCLDENRIDDLRNGLIYVVAGTNLLRFKAANTFVTPVVTAIKHRLYNNDDSNAHDVAILKLKTPAPIDNIHIGLIPLSTSPTEKNTQCLISGWGTTDFGNSYGSSYLKSANVPIIDTSECVKKYSPKFVVTSDMICAGYEAGGVDSCQGDSGGPLVCNNELTGVVSWGYKCGMPSHPGVYASVSYHKKWIDEAIAKVHPATPNPTQIPTIPNPTQTPTIPNPTQRPTTPNPIGKPNGANTRTFPLVIIFASVVFTIYLQVKIL